MALKSRPRRRCNGPSTRNQAAASWILMVYDAGFAGEVIGRLPLLDAVALAATCRRLQGFELRLFLTGRSVDCPGYPRSYENGSSMRSSSASWRCRGVISVLPPSTAPLPEAHGRRDQGHRGELSRTLGAQRRGLTDEGIKAIAANCPALTKLDVGGCQHQ